jgi:hypothetical protein
MLLLVACGSQRAQKTDAKKWVSTFCKAANTWQIADERSRNQFNSNKYVKAWVHRSRSVTVVEVKTQYVAAIGRLIAYTKHWRDTVKAAGAPDIRYGSEIEKSVTAFLSGLVMAYTTLKKGAERLPTTNFNAYVLQLSVIFDTFEKSGFERSGFTKRYGYAKHLDIQKPFRRYVTPDLKRIFVKDGDCKELPESPMP